MTDSLVLKDGPMEVTISPHSEIYEPGNKLTCSSNGFPPSSYEWQYLVNGSVVAEGPVLLITDDMVDNKINLFECTATNNVLGIKKTARIHFTVREATSNKGTGLIAVYKQLLFHN